MDVVHSMENTPSMITILHLKKAFTGRIESVLNEHVETRMTFERLLVKTSTNRNVDNQNVDKPKRQQTKTSTDRNVDKPKRRHSETSA